MTLATPTRNNPQLGPPSNSTRRQGARRKKAATGVYNLLGLLAIVVMGFPIYWMINTSFKPTLELQDYNPHFYPHHPTLSNFADAFHSQNFVADVENSVIITGSAVAISLVIGFLAALAIARFKFYGKRVLIFIILLIQMVPLLALIIPMYIALNNQNATNTLYGVVIAYLVFTVPYTVWTLRGFIANIPKELDEAAMVDGCNRWQTFLRIILPLTGPGLVATSIYGFILAWNEFILISTLNPNSDKQNLMAWLVENTTARGTAWGPMMAGSVLTSIPVVVLFLAIQKNLATGLTAGAVKG
jgi:N,N'-diacetylchitobiose transport system permease protein